MFILLYRPTCHCFACEKVARSRINPLFLAAFALMVAAAAVAFYLKVPLGRAPSSAPLGWLVPAALALGLFFSPRAHSCPRCGSIYLKRTDH